MANEVQSGTLAGMGVILLVDDDRLVRISIASLLEKSGYEVHTAEDGIEAVEVFEQHADRIQIVLLDMVMPRLDGAGCFARLRAIDPTIPVVLLSGFAPGESVEQLLDQGLAAVLRKPFRLAELSELVRRHIRAPSESSALADHG